MKRVRVKVVKIDVHERNTPKLALTDSDLTNPQVVEELAKVLSNPEIRIILTPRQIQVGETRC